MSSEKRVNEIGVTVFEPRMHDALKRCFNTPSWRRFRRRSLQREAGTFALLFLQAKGELPEWPVPRVVNNFPEDDPSPKLSEDTIDKVDHLQRDSAQLESLSRILGRIAPAGTAPRIAFERIWDQSQTTDQEPPEAAILRKWLESHWGDWSDGLR